MSQTQAPKPQRTEQTEQAQKQDEAPKANEQKAEPEAPKQGTEQEEKEQDTAPEAQGLEQNEAFARISGVIDIPYMKDCTVIGIGCGGARGFYEDMARIGVGSFYLIDGDISSRSNIASQNGYISEIVKPKPEVVKARLLDINDEIKAHAINRMLNEQMTDEWLYENIFKENEQL